MLLGSWIPLGLGRSTSLKYSLDHTPECWEWGLISQTHQKLGQALCLLLCFLRLENKAGGNNFALPGVQDFVFSAALVCPHVCVQI